MKKNKNYIIAIILFILGFFPFVYVISMSIPACKGYNIFGKRIAYGIDGVIHSIIDYLILYFPLFLISIILIVISYIIVIYTILKKR